MPDFLPSEFLSPEWMAEVERAAPPVDPAASFTLDQRVVGGPTGEVRYVIALRNGRLSVRSGPPEVPADLSIQVPFLVSAALASGGLSVHDAILDGAIKVSGDLQRLQAAEGVLAVVAEAMAGVRERTIYPS